jgi:hypothetical protein
MKHGASSADSQYLITKVTGSSANDLVSDAIFKSMVVEVVYVQGFEPTATAINDVVTFEC